MLTRCCCCFDHRRGVMAMALIFAIINLALAILLAIDLSKEYTKSGVISASVGLVISLVMVAGNGLLWTGCYKHNRKLFLPWLVIQMLAIIVAYLFAILLLVAGIMTLVYSDKISGTLLLDKEGNVSNGDKYTIVGGLAGITAISAAFIIMVATSVAVYLWATVQHLYRSLGYRPYLNIVQIPTNPKYDRNS